MEKILRKSALALGVLAFLAAAPAFAADYTWKGDAGDGNWANPANWNPSTGYPSSSSDSAIIPASTTAQITSFTPSDGTAPATLTVGNVYVNGSSGTLVLSCADTALLTGENLLKITNTGAKLKITETAPYAGVSINIDGNLYFPAGAAFSDITHKSTTVHVTGDVSGPTTLFTLSAAEPTFAGTSVTLDDSSTATFTKTAAASPATGYIYSVGTHYYWIGGNDGDNTQKKLGDAANWSTSASDSTQVAAAAPAKFDVAHFTSASSAKIAGDSTFAAAIDIADGVSVTLMTQSNSTTGTVSGNITVGAGATARLLAYNNTATTLAFTGKLLGTGTVQCANYGTGSNKVVLDSADFSQFAGVFKAASITQLANTAIPVDNSAASWDLSAMASGYKPFQAAATLYKFGALNANIAGNETNGKRAAVEIGARNEDCAVAGTWYEYNNANAYCNAVRWIATSATLSWNVANSYEIVVSGGGAIDISSGSVTTEFKTSNGSFESSNYLYNNTFHSACEIDFTGAGGYLAMDGTERDAAVLAKVAAVESTAVFGITNATAVSLDLSAKNTLLAGKNLGKKGAGDLTLTGLSGTFGDVSVDGGKLVIPQGITISCLSLAEGAKLSVPYTGSESDTQILTISSLAEGTTQAMLEEALAAETGVTVSVAENEGAYTVSATRSALTYTWTGAAGDGKWETLSNWLVGEDVPTMPPTIVDTALFEGTAAVAVAGLTRMGPIQLGENAVLSLSSSSTVYACGDITGTGLLKLDGIVFRTTSKAVTISCPVDVPAEKTATFEIGDNGYMFILSGKLTGSGTIDSHSTTGNQNTYSGLNLTGDGSDFAGTVKLYSSSSQQRDEHVIKPSATSSNAVWRVFADSSNTYISRMPFREGAGMGETVYYFGACDFDFKNPNQDTYGKFTMEIGALDIASSLKGSSGDKSKFGNNTAIRWIAPTAAITNSVVNLNTLEIAGGGVAVVASADLPQQIKFTGNGGTLRYAPGENTPLDLSAILTYSTAAIAFDDEGASYTWATALAASNTGGFVKKGSGTLTLAAAPLYTGATAVEEGTLIVPAGTAFSSLSLGEGAKIGIPSDATVAEGDTVLSVAAWDGAATPSLSDFSLPEGDYVIEVSQGGFSVKASSSATGYAKIDDVELDYGADFTNATVTLTVAEAYSGETPSYTLTLGGKTYTASGSAGQVVFENVALTRSETAYDQISYSISSTADSTTGTTSGSDTVAVSTAWIEEDSTHNGTSGTWASALSYSNGKASVMDNSFTTASASQGDIVKLEITAKFSEINADELDSAPQGAVRVGGSGAFEIYSAGEWKTAAWGENGEPDANTEYNVAMVFDYTRNSGAGAYSVAVAGTALTVDESAWFALGKTVETKSVQTVGFDGEGSFCSMAGTWFEGYMAQYGSTKYLTMEAALAAAEDDSTAAEAGSTADAITITLLHQTGVVADDWSEANGVWTWTGDVAVTLDGVKIEVPSAWISSHLSGKTITERRTLLAPDCSQTAANGYNYYTCYALGLAPENAASVPEISMAQSNGDFVCTLGGIGETPDGISVTITAQRWNGTAFEDIPGQTGSSVTLSPKDITGNGSIGQMRFNIAIVNGEQ